MSQEKRVLVAFAVSFAVLMLWRSFIFKEPPPPPKKAPAPEARPPAPEPPAAVRLRKLEGSKPEEIAIEGDLYRVTLSSQGAVVKSWVFKKYRDARANPLDVINHAACEQLGFPLSFNLADPTLNSKLNSALYMVKPPGASLKAPAEVEFSYSDGKIQARKKLSFSAGYEVRASVDLFDGERYLPVEVAWPGGFGDHSLPPKITEAVSQVVYGTAEDVTRVGQGKVKEDRVIPGPLQLAGVQDRYFADVFLPGAPDQAFRMGRRVWTPADWKGKEEDKPKPLIAMLGSSLPKPLAFRLFVAPKDLDVLRGVKPPLDRLVDFGWFSFIAKPLFLGLRYIYDRWVHNYGWAIVLLTVFINLAMFPLKLKSIRSAQEMQRIGPQVKAIQDRYKQYKFNDPRKQRMNQEVMSLYKQHGINPFGSCLPMLLQLPFLYGFYRVLDLSIELRHAPWILWIKDLSAPDNFRLFGLPLPILPTVMIVTMYVLQKMTPMTTVDPAQQRMMMIMPLAFGIMFYNFASGLVLYWLTGNIVGIAQQAFINRVMPLPQPSPTSTKAAPAREKA